MKQKKKVKAYTFDNAFDRLVSVEWNDSQTTYGWRLPEKDDLPSEIKSVGILLSNTETSVTISTSISKGGRFVDKLTIPKSSIRKLRHFKLEIGNK